MKVLFYLSFHSTHLHHQSIFDTTTFQVILNIIIAPFAMAPRIFITGVSGYIGGQTLASVVAKHPEYTVVGLVRNEEKKQQILAKLPSVKLVIGDLDSSDLLTEEAKTADVILRMFLKRIQMLDCVVLTPSRSRRRRPHRRHQRPHQRPCSRQKERCLHPSLRISQHHRSSNRLRQSLPQDLG